MRFARPCAKRHAILIGVICDLICVICVELACFLPSPGNPELGLVGAGYVGPAFSVEISIASRAVVLFLMALEALFSHLVARGIVETFDDRHLAGRSDMGTVGSSSRLVRAIPISGSGYRRDTVLGIPRLCGNPENRLPTGREAILLDG
jgi:hypothetical protein